LRPNTWITPIGNWGKGQIKLVEIPSSKEVNDNIVAYWVPKNLPPLGQLIEIAYRIHFQSEDFLDAASGRVTATRVGASVPISVPSKRIFACSTPAPQC
jgi:periplasmic glucans biosynthesis protein